MTRRSAATKHNLLPCELEFVRQHFRFDMLPAEIAAALGIPQADVLLAIYGTWLHGPACRLTAICTPYAPRVAADVRKATSADRYKAMDGAEFQQKFRPKGWVRP